MSPDTDDDFEPPPPPHYDTEDATPTASDFSDDIAGNSFSGLLGAGLETPPPGSLPDDIDKWQPPSPEHLNELLREAQIEVHHLIGRGGMGAVYKGLQVKLNRIVAIKILPPELARSEDFVGRFKREAQVLASLTYPHIVAIYDFGQTTESHLYFVMEYVPGTDLAKFIRAGQLTADLALKLTTQICDALQFAHDHGVIHRDIKPANVLVTSDGKQAKLADFGLAMRPSDPDEPIPDIPVPAGKATPLRPLDPTGLRYTRTGHGMGTPPYAAPEVYAGVADERSDIFALGIMLYELLTGSPPEARYVLPSQKVGVAPALDDVVIKALEGEPDARFQSAGEMKQAVEQATQPLSTQLALTPAAIQVIPPQTQALTTSHQSLRQQQALAAQREAYRAKAQEIKRRSWLSRLVTLLCLAIIAAIAFDAGQQWAVTKRGLAAIRSLTQQWHIALPALDRASKAFSQQADPTATTSAPKLPVQVASPIAPIVGRWVFFNGSVRTFHLDGSSIDEAGQTARWHQPAPAQRPSYYEVVYEGGRFTDYLTLTNGNSLEGIGFNRIHVTAGRLSFLITAQTTAADVERDLAGVERLRKTLLSYRWHYTDVGWPSSTVDFFTDSTFHSQWHWHYWIRSPQEIHVQFWDRDFKPAGGDRFTFNAELTRFECPKADGRQRIVGTRL